MLELIITIMLSLGLNVQFSDNGTLQLDEKSRSQILASEEYQSAFGDPNELDKIIVNDQVDPKN